MSNSYLILSCQRGITAHEVRNLLHQNEDHGECRGLLDLEFGDVTGRTALFYAIANNNYEVAQVLIQKGNANVNVRDRWGETPLHVASQRGHVESISVLLEAGADANSMDRFGKTPLRLVCESSLSPPYSCYLAKRQKKVISLLIEQGKADVNSVSWPDQSTVLHVACAGGFQGNYNHHIVSSLLEHGANVHAIDPLGQTPLHIASRCCNSAQVIRLLLEHGANPNAIPCLAEDGWTALHMACAARHQHKEQGHGANNAAATAGPTVVLECVECLLAYGADCFQSDKTGTSPLALASRHLDMHLVQAMLLLSITTGGQLAQQQTWRNPRIGQLPIVDGGGFNRHDRKKEPTPNVLT